MTKEYVKVPFKVGGIKGEYEGRSDMPFWNHDLTLELVIGLLNTVDYKEFFESGKLNELDNYTKQLIEAMEYSLGFDGLYQLVYEDTKKD
ncbi:hypothetical protein ACS47_04230 [Bacillus cereus]|uniref:hypothetical protein n=1 Tax=Bacillus paranthracis TaxID=2026186 RepID=UPI000772652C|nr:hypothetical protein [Bacillus paranthracis]KXI93012.1 hypothetical protein ACS47_04230 [Bacillus cereus]MDG0887591.1 hypothetical protein [Bacillus paranthracis]MDG1640075.1 hypothetical protein [Bacillus paranthracis]